MPKISPSKTIPPSPFVGILSVGSANIWPSRIKSLRNSWRALPFGSSGLISIKLCSPSPKHEDYNWKNSWPRWTKAKRSHTWPTGWPISRWPTIYREFQKKWLITSFTSSGNRHMTIPRPWKKLNIKRLKGLNKKNSSRASFISIHRSARIQMWPNKISARS